jgi:hypothetical protein
MLELGLKCVYNIGFDTSITIVITTNVCHHQALGFTKHHMIYYNLNHMHKRSPVHRQHAVSRVRRLFVGSDFSSGRLYDIMNDINDT